MKQELNTKEVVAISTCKVTCKNNTYDFVSGEIYILDNEVAEKLLSSGHIKLIEKKIKNKNEKN